jgi:hypothetical protein
VRFGVLAPQKEFPGTGNKFRPRALSRATESEMLVERGMWAMNVEVVGEAYAIASNYLRRTGTIPDSYATNEQLLTMIVEMFRRGETNKIKLANKAIAEFEAAQLVI